MRTSTQTNQELLNLLSRINSAYALMALNTRRTDEALPLVTEARQVIEKHTKQTTEENTHV